MLRTSQAIAAALLLGASAFGFAAAQWASPKSVGGAAAAAPAPAAASTAPGEAAVRKAVLSLASGIRIESLHPAPIAGFTEVKTEDDFLYVSNDGKYLLTGNVIDLTTRRNLTEVAKANARRGLLKAITPAQKIVFAPKNPKYAVTVFTDVDCGYCRKLHSQIADYNKEGIEVDYLFFPREGVNSPSFDKAVAVWCAADRQKALTEAKKGVELPKKNCTNPVTMDYNLGIRVGVDGTPSIYTADGMQIGGYLSPEDMKAKLDKLAAQPNG